jgi:Fur family transcriptional regulator, ferric uptake regulator
VATADLQPYPRRRSLRNNRSLLRAARQKEQTFMTNIDELKSTGLKATLPRLKILEIFQKGEQRHMTAEDVFRVLMQERSDIGLATVYRVLTQFEQAAILSRSHFESGKAVFELNEGQHHDHFVCTSCGKVEEFYDAEIEKRQQSVAKAKGWLLQDHAMSLYGLCADCAKAAKKAAQAA